jgi:hypothetical protein
MVASRPYDPISLLNRRDHLSNNWLRVFRSARAARSDHRRRQQQHTSVVWSEKCGGLWGTAWHKMQVIAGFFGSGALAALPGHGAAFFRYFKKLARFTKLATNHLPPAERVV